MLTRNASAISFAILTLAACASDEQSSRSGASLLNGCTVGAALGAAAGGIGGAFLNGGSRSSPLKKYGIPALGAGAGGWLGSQVGCLLSQTDQARAGEAVRITASSGKPQSWSSADSGTSGETRVVSNAGACRTIEQAVTLADGTKKTEQVRACRGRQGWEAET